MLTRQSMLSPERLRQMCTCCLPKQAGVPPPNGDVLKDPVNAKQEELASPPSAAPKRTGAEENANTPEKPRRKVSKPASKQIIPDMTDEKIFAMDAADVLNTMKNRDYEGNASLMSAACKQLRMLCRQDELCDECDQLNAASVIRQCMRKHIDSPIVQQQGCAALINLCAGDSFARRDHASNSDAIGAIVEAMDAHLEYPGIQEMACVAIQNICFGHDANGQSRRQKAIRAGALEAIVQATLKYEVTPSVVDQGSAALRLLCHKSSTSKAQALAAGAKKEWFRPATSLAARVGGLLTNRKGRKNE